MEWWHQWFFFTPFLRNGLCIILKRTLIQLTVIAVSVLCAKLCHLQRLSFLAILAYIMYTHTFFHALRVVNVPIFLYQYRIRQGSANDMKVCNCDVMLLIESSSISFQKGNPRIHICLATQCIEIDAYFLMKCGKTCFIQRWINVKVEEIHFFYFLFFIIIF